jgi:hypothetical protein
MFRSSASDADYSASTNGGNESSSQSMQQLFDDFAVIRPVQISSVPRMWNVLYTQFNKLLFIALTANKLLPNPKAEGIYVLFPLFPPCELTNSISS